MALSGHGGVRKYKDFEKLFSEIVFTPDECNIVRNSLQKDGVEKKPEKILFLASQYFRNR